MAALSALHADIRARPDRPQSGRRPRTIRRPPTSSPRWRWSRMLSPSSACRRCAPPPEMRRLRRSAPRQDPGDAGGTGTSGTVVFNLMEAPAGSRILHPGSAAFLEIAGIPFTGWPAAALWLTTDKVATRAVLAAEGLPVPAGGRLDLADPEVLDHVLTRVSPPWILKPACEDASVGIEGNPVCATREEALEPRGPPRRALSPPAGPRRALPARPRAQRLAARRRGETRRRRGPAGRRDPLPGLSGRHAARRRL